MYKFSAPVPTIYYGISLHTVRSICAAISYSNAPLLCSGLFPQVVFFRTALLPLHIALLCGGALNDEYFALIRKLFHPCAHCIMVMRSRRRQQQHRFQGSFSFFVCAGILLQIVAIKISPSVILHELMC
jgi:hypothetical protein